MSTSGDAESLVRTLAQQAQAALRDGRLADAAQFAENLRAQAPDDPNTDLFGGIVAYKQGRYVQAIAHFERLRRKHPSNSSAQFWLGNALRHEGRLDEAAEIYRAVLQGSPSDDARANLESTENLRRIEKAGRLALTDDRHSPSATMLQAAVNRAADLARTGIKAPTSEHVPIARNLPLISFITCTITEAKLERLRASLAVAMDSAPWELVPVTDARSLCEGYTRGFTRSRGELVVFCHDDIEVLCDRFSDRLIDAFDGADIFGVAGATKLNGPALGWAGAPFLHGSVTHPEGELFFPSLCSSAGPRVEGAQGLDGLFIATRRDVVESIGFDAETFDAFDFYDVDFTYRAWKAGLRLRIQTDLHLLHASRGKFGPRYAFYSERFRAKNMEFANAPAYRRANFHQVTLASRDETRRFHTWIGHWLRGMA
jgi:Glycosyltransferase like family/Tetratricopeptide repeat